MKHEKVWSRGDKIALVGVIATVVGILIALLFPEVRVWLRLEKRATVPAAIVPVPPATSRSVVTPSPLAKPETAQRSKTSVKGKDNVAGNNVAGNGNVVGNKNQITTAAPVIVEPGSIGITGGTVTNPTVNNYGALPEQPGPNITPTVTICLSEFPATGQNYVPGDSYVITLTLQTDTPITRPSYGFLFDGPVGDGDVSFSGLSTTPYVNNLKLLHYEDRSYAFKLITTDFPSGSDVWSPGVVIKATVPSRTRVRLTEVLSLFGKEQKVLAERLKFTCGSSVFDQTNLSLHIAR